MQPVHAASLADCPAARSLPKQGPATITLLFDGGNGELKNAAEGNFLTRLLQGTQQELDERGIGLSAIQ